MSLNDQGANRSSNWNSWTSNRVKSILLEGFFSKLNIWQINFRKIFCDIFHPVYLKRRLIMTHGLSKTHLWGQLAENCITLNPYNFYRLSRIGKIITAINLACKKLKSNRKWKKIWYLIKSRNTILSPHLCHGKVLFCMKNAKIQNPKT